jgi:hypothetical protein
MGGAPLGQTVSCHAAALHTHRSGETLMPNRLPFTVVTQLRQVLATAIVQLHHPLCNRLLRGNPASLSYWRRLRLLLHLVSRHQNVLASTRGVITTADALTFKMLSQDLKGVTLGDWALDARTLELLWRSLTTRRPSTILEFGSGASTVVLARYGVCTDASGGPDITIISLEQNEDAATSTEMLLKSAGLEGRATILVCPLNKDGAYQIADDALVRALKGRRLNWILIDGPFGPPGCRIHTLDRLMHLCEANATWFLHDALRDAELEVLHQWQNRPSIRVDGIYSLGEGLATGTVNPYGCVS